MDDWYVLGNVVGHVDCVREGCFVGFCEVDICKPGANLWSSEAFAKFSTVVLQPEHT